MTHSGCDCSAEGAYSSMAPDTTLAFVEGWRGSCCSTLDWYLWCIMLFRSLPSPKYVFRFTIYRYHQEHFRYHYILTPSKQQYINVVLFFIFIVILNIVWHSSITSMGMTVSLDLCFSDHSADRYTVFEVKVWDKCTPAAPQ
jgi:hypothetical protein